MKLAPPLLLALLLLPGCRLFGIGIPCDEDLDCPSKRPFCVENVCAQFDDGLELVDGGAPADAGSTVDAGETVDAGVECTVGSEGCPCTAGNGCDPGLTCLSNTCVNLGEDPDGGTPEDGGAVVADGGAVTPDGGGTADAGPADAGSVIDAGIGGWPIAACRNSIVATGEGAIGDVSSDWSLSNQFGETVRLYNFCDRVVLLSSAAGWDAASQQAAPGLTELYGEYGDQGLMVMTLVFDTNSPPDAVSTEFLQEWAAQFNHTFPVLADPEHILALHYPGDGNFVPYNVLLGRGAEILAKAAGAGAITEEDIVAALAGN